MLRPVNFEEVQTLPNASLIGKSVHSRWSANILSKVPRKSDSKSDFWMVKHLEFGFATLELHLPKAQMLWLKDHSRISAPKKTFHSIYEWIHVLSNVKYWHVHTVCQCSTNMIIYVYDLSKKTKLTPCSGVLPSSIINWCQIQNSTSIWHHQSSTFIASWSPSLTPKTQIKPLTPAKATITTAWNIVDKSINPICPSCLHACMLLHLFMNICSCMYFHYCHH